MDANIEKALLTTLHNLQNTHEEPDDGYDRKLCYDFFLGEYERRAIGLSDNHKTILKYHFVAWAEEINSYGFDEEILNIRCIYVVKLKYNYDYIEQDIVNMENIIDNLINARPKETLPENIQLMRRIKELEQEKETLNNNIKNITETNKRIFDRCQGYIYSVQNMVREGRTDENLHTVFM